MQTGSTNHINLYYSSGTVIRIVEQCIDCVREASSGSLPWPPQRKNKWKLQSYLCCIFFYFYTWFLFYACVHNVFQRFQTLNNLQIKSSLLANYVQAYKKFDLQRLCFELNVSVCANDNSQTDVSRCNVYHDKYHVQLRLMKM